MYSSSHVTNGEAILNDGEKPKGSVFLAIAFALINTTKMKVYMFTINAFM